MTTQKFQITEKMLDNRLLLLEAECRVYDRIAIAEGRTTKEEVEQWWNNHNHLYPADPPPARPRTELIGEIIEGWDDGAPLIVEGLAPNGIIVSRITSDNTDRHRKRRST